MTAKTEQLKTENWNMTTSRSSQKRITKEAIVLRYLRLSKKLSLNKAGRLIGITGSAIAHIEGGRMDVSRARIDTMVTAYGYTMDQYLEFFDSDALPVNLRDECVGIVRQLDDVKLQAVHAVLVNFMPVGATRTAQSPSRVSAIGRRP
jgi:transcriptional regulator with XRE-family HTH domain